MLVQVGRGMSRSIRNVVGVVGGSVAVSLADANGIIITPETEVILTPDPGDGRARLDAGTWMNWTAGDTFDDLTLADEIVALAAGNVALDVDGNSGSITDSMTVTVPTIVMVDATDWYTDASGNTYIY